MPRIAQFFIRLVFLSMAMLAVSCVSPSGVNLYDRIHTAYLEQDDATYAQLLRVALYHAHRSHPDICVEEQRKLIDYGGEHGFDGLESLWLIYQDCSAASMDKLIIKQRQENAELVSQIIKFKTSPYPQIPQRVSRWNSLIERGVRGDAVRLLMETFAVLPPTAAQGFSHAQLIALRPTWHGLCGLEYRLDQHGNLGLMEVIRQAQCLIDEPVGVSGICDTLASYDDAALMELADDMGAMVGLATDDRSRLRDFCQMSGGGIGAGATGMDSFDSASSDMCVSGTRSELLETQRVLELIDECYDTGSGNPLASDLAREPAILGEEMYRDEILTWENAGTHNAFVTVGAGKEGDHYHATGSSADEAMQRLTEQIQNDPAADEKGITTEVADDGTTTIRVRTESDPTESLGPGGITTSARSREQTLIRRPDGSTTMIDSKTRRIEFPDGSTTEVTTTETTNTTTDDDGNTITTTNKERTTTTTDADGTSETRTEDLGTTSSVQPPESGSDDAGFDPHNPACQELMENELLIGDLIRGGGNAAFWDDIFRRDFWVDPRTINPNPDEVAPGMESGEPFCDTWGLGQNPTGNKCNLPITCAPGSELTDSCTCEQPLGGQITQAGCFTALCPDDTTPVPVGMNQCICQGGSDDTDGRPPSGGPLPDPAVISEFGEAGPFGELLWNRGEGGVSAPVND